MRLRGLVSPNVAAAVALTLGGATEAGAHPGHGLDSSGVGLLHYLLDLSHGGKFVMLALVGLAVVAIAIAEARRSQRR
jgi:hypothetical protein